MCLFVLLCLIIFYIPKSSKCGGGGGGGDYHEPYVLVFGSSWQCVLGTEWGKLGWMVVLPDHVRRFCKFLLPFWFQGWDSVT